MWLDPEGEMLEYRGSKYKGPKKPYAFSLSVSEVKQIAINNGMPNPEEPSLRFGEEFQGITESVVWLVETTKVKDKETEAIWIDVDTGKVLKKLVFEEQTLKYW
jgi:hypothetical protein